ncbi:MAG: cell division protein ZipA [Luminiphilus sp.]|jgi:cell division protein ZipA
MEQLSIRDWMILIGGMMIAAVLVDAVRRYWRERRAELKLNARIEKSDPLSNDDDAFNLLTELPNGGARIVQRDDLQLDERGQLPGAASGSVEQDGASLPEDEPSAAEPPSAAMPDPIDVAVKAQAPVSDPVSHFETPEPGLSSAAEGERPVDSATRRRTVKPPSNVAPDPSEAPSHDAGTVDWLDTLEPEQEAETDGPEHGRLPRGANTHVFILYVVARSEESFSGMDILETLLACDLRFGDMDFFHRHERASGRGAIEFSVANMMKPGVFDIDNMEPLQTRGLMFFVTLPGPADMLKAFDYMYETVKVVAKALDADIQDETRSVITRQSLEHMRQQIRELERRLLVRRN